MPPSSRRAQRRRPRPGRPHASVIGADELRFSDGEIGDLFDRRLSPSELDTLAKESAGWPMALRIGRNSAGAPQAGEARGIAENWVETRLWEGIHADDRELVLDAGLFEWMDAPLLDEVLGGTDSLRRLAPASSTGERGS